MSSSTSHTTRPLPGWLRAVCSGVAIAHLSLIGLFALASTSGPWLVPPPFGSESLVSLAPGPQFATSITESFTFPYYLKPLGMTNTYHFASNRPETFVAYFEAHIKGKDDKVAVLKFPDEKANSWVRHRQQILAQVLTQDQRQAPLGSQGVTEPGKMRKFEVWKPNGEFKLKLENASEVELNPTQSYEHPSPWAKIAWESYARFLLREHNAASVELIRCSRPTVPPMMVPMAANPNMQPPQEKQLRDNLTETRANFGEYPRE